MHTFFRAEFALFCERWSNRRDKNTSCLELCRTGKKARSLRELSFDSVICEELSIVQRSFTKETEEILLHVSAHMLYKGMVNLRSSPTRLRTRVSLPSSSLRIPLD